MSALCQYSGQGPFHSINSSARPISVFGMERPSCFGGLEVDDPVRLPPGRLRLVTSPAATGSAPVWYTQGNISVSSFVKGNGDKDRQ